MAPSSQTTLAALIANVRMELGTFDDPAWTDARITDYLNEGQAWMLPDVTRHLSATYTVVAAAASITLTADHVRLVMVYANAGQPALADYIELDGLLKFLDPTQVVAATGFYTYEGSYPKIDGSNPCKLPDPGNEGIVAFATWRILERLVVNRDDYKRYSTQTGSNVVAPADIAEIAQLYQQRYSAVRDNLAQRTAAVASVNFA